MAWMELLQKTYQYAYASSDARTSIPPLLPISHTTQNANVDVTIDMLGNFVDAHVVADDDKMTLIPCTEESSSRTGPGAKMRPHPLHDKLQYVAGDYVDFGGTKGDASYRNYIEALGLWCESDFGHKFLQAVYNYVAKGTLIADLVDSGVLHLDSKGQLMEKWDEESGLDRPPIFASVAGAQSEAFIRFRVRLDDGMQRINLWEDDDLIERYIAYFESSQSAPSIDYVTGTVMPCAATHPKKIRHTGDQAKLLSANDSSGFTYRGRFEEAEEAAQVGYLVSQQAHNALKWLISKQGTRIGARVFLTWGTTNPSLPDPIGSTLDVESNIDDDEFIDLFERGEEYRSEELWARRLNLSLRGYRQNIAEHCQIAVMAVDSATTGRLALTYFKEYMPNEQDEFFDHIEEWHQRLAWRNLGYNKTKQETRSFFGAPSLTDIATSAFGVQRGDFLDLDDRVKSATVQRLFPLVLNKNLLMPADVVNAAYVRACHPQSYSSFNWSKVRGVACSLIKAQRYQQYGEEWTMDVNLDTGDLAYNLGLYLAVLDTIESDAMYDADSRDSKRPTSAQRLFSKFADRPNATLRIIANQLVPYRARLGNRGNKLYELEQQIASRIEPAQLANARYLDGRFLLGFDAMKHAIIQGRKQAKADRDVNDD